GEVNDRPLSIPSRSRVVDRPLYGRGGCVGRQFGNIAIQVWLGPRKGRLGRGYRECRYDRGIELGPAAIDAEWIGRGERVAEREPVAVGERTDEDDSQPASPLRPHDVVVHDDRTLIADADRSAVSRVEDRVALYDDHGGIIGAAGFDESAGANGIVVPERESPGVADRDIRPLRMTENAVVDAEVACAPQDLVAGCGIA